jgi:uncharacterized protein YigA (DUF484 family)
MDKVDEIKRINQEISAKFSKIEIHISYAKTITRLFEALFSGIEKEFAVPFVWLTLIEGEKTIPIIEAVQSSPVLKNKLGIISGDLFKNILPDGLQPVLANKEMQLYYKLMPSTNKFFIKSVAVVPFKVEDEIAGRWNSGDVLSDRYLPDMDTRLLQKLGQKVSTCLTELVSAKK